MLKFSVQAKEKEQKKIYIQHFWDAIDEYYNQIALFEGFRCGSGCFHCCFDNPHGVSAIEVERIVTKIHAHQKKRIEMYFQDWNQLPQEDSRLRQQVWKKKCKPCPLLEDGKCSVYDVRPLACRSFFSIHNPEWCHPLHPNYQKHPQIGHDDIHSLLEKLSIQRGWSNSQDLISGLHHHMTENKP